MDLQTVGPLLASGVIASLVTAIFTKMTADKNVRIENITKERKQWRDHMRELGKEANEAFHDTTNGKVRMKVVEAALMVRLNPGDLNDQLIIDTARELPNGDINKLNNFNQHMAVLLKHDWERVKLETSATTSGQTLSITAIALIAAIGFVVWAMQCKYLISMPPVYVLVIGAVLYAVFRSAWVYNEYLSNRAKLALDKKRTAGWK